MDTSNPEQLPTESIRLVSPLSMRASIGPSPGPVDRPNTPSSCSTFPPFPSSSPHDHADSIEDPGRPPNSLKTTLQRQADALKVKVGAVASRAREGGSRLLKGVRRFFGDTLTSPLSSASQGISIPYSDTESEMVPIYWQNDPDIDLRARRNYRPDTLVPSLNTCLMSHGANVRNLPSHIKTYQQVWGRDRLMLHAQSQFDFCALVRMSEKDREMLWKLLFGDKILHIVPTLRRGHIAYEHHRCTFKDSFLPHHPRTMGGIGRHSVCWGHSYLGRRDPIDCDTRARCRGRRLHGVLAMMLTCRKMYPDSCQHRRPSPRATNKSQLPRA